MRKSSLFFLIVSRWEATSPSGLRVERQQPSGLEGERCRTTVKSPPGEEGSEK